MLEKGSARLPVAMNNREFNEIGIAEVFIATANTKLIVLKRQLIENSENSNQLRKTKGKKRLKYNSNIVFLFLLLKTSTNTFI